VLPQDLQSFLFEKKLTIFDKRSLEMVIERTEEGILIKTTADVNNKDVQKIIDYFNLKELISKNEGTEENAEELSRETEKKWWEENKHRFGK
jgi:hypothetical protein